MPVRMAFRSITTDVNGLYPGHTTKVDAINKKAVKRMEKDMKRVSGKFKHANKPTYRTTVGIGQPPDSGGGPVGRAIAPPHLRARWAMSSTENDPIFYYLEVGARRFRRMSLDWQSMTRGGMGLATFPRAGTAMNLSPFQVGYIEPRYFAIDAAIRQRLWYEREIRKLFGEDAIYKFFGRVVRR